MFEYFIFGKMSLIRMMTKEYGASLTDAFLVDMFTGTNDWFGSSTPCFVLQLKMCFVRHHSWTVNIWHDNLAPTPMDICQIINYPFQPKMDCKRGLMFFLRHTKIKNEKKYKRVAIEILAFLSLVIACDGLQPRL